MAPTNAIESSKFEDRWCLRARRDKTKNFSTSFLRAKMNNFTFWKKQVSGLTVKSLKTNQMNTFLSSSTWKNF